VKTGLLVGEIHYIPISKIQESAADVDSEASGGGPHQTEKFVSSLSDTDVADWSLNCIEDTSRCADTVRETSGQSREDSVVNARCSC